MCEENIDSERLMLNLEMLVFFFYNGWLFEVVVLILLIFFGYSRFKIIWCEY